jgi:DNA invertase Pin-like site-specific DNA recombinase
MFAYEMPRKPSKITKVAYSYVRFSRPEQMRGDSLRRQVEESTKWATENGYTIRDLKFEDKGKSAFTGSHLEGALGRFLSAIVSGVVQPGDSLLIESLDRLSRDEVIESLAIFTKILKRGVQIITYSDRRIYSQENISDIGQIIYSIMIMARAHEESQMKSQRLSKRWENKRSTASTKKLTAIAPYWLKLNGNTFEPIEERVKIVQRIFSLALEGRGIDRISKELNLAGVPSWRRKTGWQKSYILKILHNRAVLGEFQPHAMHRIRKDNGVIKRVRQPSGDAHQGYFPAVITSDVFNRVQRALTTRKFIGAGRRGELHNLFTHICQCANCGGSAVFINKGPKWKYLACDSARRKAKKCEYVSWPYENFEKTFWAFVRGLDYGRIANVDFQGHLDSLELELDGLRAKEAAENKRLDRLMSVFNAGESVPDRIVREMKETETRLKDLRAVIEEKTLAAEDVEAKRDGGSMPWTEFQKLELNTVELREQARREIREKINSIVIDFQGNDAFTKNRPSLTIKFHKEYNREYVVVPFEHDPERLHMFIETANGETTALEDND